MARRDVDFAGIVDTDDLVLRAVKDQQGFAERGDLFLVAPGLELVEELFDRHSEDLLLVIGQFLDQLAEQNHGTRDYVGKKEDIETKISNFFQKVSSPVLYEGLVYLARAGGVLTSAEKRDLTDFNALTFYARASRDQAQAAIDAAAAALPEWSRSGVQQRANILDAVGDDIMARREELGRLLSREEGKTLPEGVTSGMLAQNQLVRRPANILGAHDFVCFTVLEHTVLVNAGFVGKSIRPDDGLVWLNRETGDRELRRDRRERRLLRLARVRRDRRAAIHHHRIRRRDHPDVQRLAGHGDDRRRGPRQGPLRLCRKGKRRRHL